jgi:hypothetical protein
LKDQRLGAGEAPVHHAPSLLTLALTIATIIPLHASPADSAPASPPDYPDSIHVAWGCYISTAAYLAKFAANHPGEFGAPFTAFLGVIQRHHTAALVTWRGEWWLRDEFLGVMRLGLPVAGHGVTDRVTRRAETTLAREAAKLPPALRARIAAVDHRGNSGFNAAHDVAQAAALLPFPAEVYWVTCGDGEIPLLFFRPGPGAIAVYDPHHGTATAETDTTRPAVIVQLVAQRLGYRVTSVRRDLSRLLASAGP